MNYINEIKQELTKNVLALSVTKKELTKDSSRSLSLNLADGKSPYPYVGRHDNPHNDTHHNDIQHNHK